MTSSIDLKFQESKLILEQKTNQTQVKILNTKLKIFPKLMGRPYHVLDTCLKISSLNLNFHNFQKNTKQKKGSWETIQQKRTSIQPMKVIFQYRPAILGGVQTNGYDFHLTRKILSNRIDGQRHIISDFLEIFHRIFVFFHRWSRLS